MRKVPELTQQLADDIAKTVMVQLRTSRDFKRPRMLQIRENEDLYNGIMKQSIVRETSEPFPFMSGFVDYLYSQVDEPPNVEYEHTDEADYKTAKKTTAFFNQEKDSVLPTAKWSLKDRWSKKLAIFSGKAILKYFAEDYAGYCSHLNVVDHYDFHCEPAGGGHLENHLFCGEEGIFVTKEDLEERAEEGYYDMVQVQSILTRGSQQDYKENDDEEGIRNNRYGLAALDPVSNNYVGTPVYKFLEWYITYKGIRWQVTLDKDTGTWVRIKALREVIPPLDVYNYEAFYPYVTWSTHEDPKVFWSKGPCDDARPIAKAINKLLNQEIYNREKKNKGVRFYDPEMVDDIEALVDERADSLIPINTNGGKKALSSALYRVEHGDIDGTVDLVQFLDQYHGQKSGSTASSMGQAESNKKVGIFFGEMQQIQKRLSVLNRSYREAWAEIGLRFLLGLEMYLTDEKSVKLIGANGIEWSTISKADLKTQKALSIKITGGNEEAEKNAIKQEQKLKALGQTSTVNAQWKDREILKNSGYTDDGLKDAFNNIDASSQELMSEAAEAIEMIVSGKKMPELNRGANVAFMQKIIDFGNNLSLDDKKKENQIATLLYKYAEDHASIVAENEARKAQEMVIQASAGAFMANANTPEGVAMASSTMANTAMNSAVPETPAKISPVSPSQAPTTPALF